ncbi:SAM-dependent methyltransferase [Bacillus sp. LL01]|uniref:class I SAM-dependent methyltransferase n=1 Tax=Bacillus sp. LL01 TaxID=1665556 RepID=UPI00064D40C7|nr:class I SAM-dependent methyltransferase [Bacillus sp. LL01]KMJ57580.1 SAM-dependent methyltransferase [Bacillus sp. LL01]
MTDFQREYDQKLNIKTSDIQMGIHRSYTYHRYEPTPYEALDCLFKKYEVESGDHVVDFGCGKGRLNFYLAHRFGASVTGIEMNETFYGECLSNLEGYSGKNKQKIEFGQSLAEKYDIPSTANRFYFFNPFTIEIFRTVVNNILLSVEQTYRSVEIILYYPAPDYVFYLENHSLSNLKLEVQLDGYEKNANERFLVYEFAY